MTTSQRPRGPDEERARLSPLHSPTARSATTAAYTSLRLQFTHYTPLRRPLESALGTTELFVFSPGPDIDPRFLYYVTASSDFVQQGAATIYGAHGVKRVAEAFARDYRIWVPPLDEQRAIADYLDYETARIDALISAKQALIQRLFERSDGRIGHAIERSALVNGREGAVELRRVLRKQREQAAPATPLVTAYRDGQVTLRSLRRPDGYTESAVDAGFQSVRESQVVIHGLDRFAGAIGTSEADGACSPVYHVCVPTSDGDPHYWGRMLRLLATSGYLSLFVTSTRERAHDMRNWDVMGRVPVPSVPVEEQREVGDQLRKIPPIRDTFEKSIRLLKERRQALITTVMTSGMPGPAEV